MEAVRADVIVYNSAISACEKCGNWQQALALLLELFDPSLWEKGNATKMKTLRPPPSPERFSRSIRTSPPKKSDARSSWAGPLASQGKGMVRTSPGHVERGCWQGLAWTSGSVPKGFLWVWPRKELQVRWWSLGKSMFFTDLDWPMGGGVETGSGCQQSRICPPPEL